MIDPESALFGHDTSRSRLFWFRMPTAAALRDPFDHECLLAFASDYWLAGTASAGYRPPPMQDRRKPRDGGMSSDLAAETSLAPAQR